MQSEDRSKSVRIRKCALKIGGPYALVFVSNLLDARYVRLMKKNRVPGQKSK